MIIFDKEKRIYYSTKINDKTYFSAFGTRHFKDVPHKFYLPTQTHSIDIKIITPREGNEIIDADGVVTNTIKRSIAVKTADCVPIIFVDKEKGITGVSHQGWKGTYNGMAKEMVNKMINLGSKKESIVAAIGPCIGSCCYDISEERYQLFKERYTKYEDTIFTKSDKIYLYLSYLNYLLLLEAGIKKDQIDFFPFCTFCNEENFFSYRRDYQKYKSNFGHMINFIIKTQ